MTKFRFLLLLLLGAFLSATGETTTINFDFSNLPAASNRLTVYNILGSYSNVIPESTLLQPDRNGKCSYSLNITSAQFLKLGFVLDETNANYIPYVLFLSPGDQINFKADFAKPGGAITVTGKGSANNQPAIQKLMFLDLKMFRQDTLPYRALSIIKNQSRLNKQILNSYIKRYKPSANFIKANHVNIEYFSAYLYYTFKEDYKYGKLEAYQRNFDIWNGQQATIFKSIKLNDDNALYAYNYVNLISWFLLREKEREGKLYDENPGAFNKQWYSGEDQKSKKFLTEQDNLFTLKIIHKYFSGKTAEFLFAQLIKKKLMRKDDKNIAALYNQFSRDYPNNIDVKIFKQPVLDLVNHNK